MTEREATERLQRIRQFYLDIIKDDTAVEAVDMAIKAVEKQEVDKCCETCRYKSRSSQEIPCCDCYMSSCLEDCYEP